MNAQDLPGERDNRRVALFLPDMGGGGAERVALAMMQGFLARGQAVDLVLSSRHGSLLDQVPNEVSVFDLGQPRSRYVVLPLARYLRERRPVALHAMMWPLPMMAVAARAVSRVDVRIVGSEHTTLSQMPHGLRWRGIRAVTRLAYRRADALVAVSGGVADDMGTFIGLPRDSIAVIHNPLLLPDELPGPELAAGLWPQGTARILAVGEFKAQKNYSLMLRAFDLVRQRVPASLLILGQGALVDEVQREADRLGMGSSLVIAGFHQDIWRFYTAAELFVLSSDYEGFGNVLTEAMHAGVPVVSTDCPSGPREILDHGRFGTLVPCGDAAALATAMVEALTTPVDRQALRSRAKEISGEEPIDRHLALMLGTP